MTNKEFNHFLSSATSAQLWAAYYEAEDEGNITKRDEIETQIRADEERTANAQPFGGGDSEPARHQYGSYCEDAPCCGCCG